MGAAIVSIGANDKDSSGAVEDVVVHSVPVGEPEVKNETSQKVFLKCLGQGGKWIQMGDWVVDKNAFYSRSETESGSNLDIQDSWHS